MMYDYQSIDSMSTTDDGPHRFTQRESRLVTIPRETTTHEYASFICAPGNKEPYHVYEEVVYMNVAIIGGSGFIGKHLTRVLAKHGHQVTIVSRRATTRTTDQVSGASWVSWHPLTCDSLEKALAGVDAVVNLAGAPIADRRWTAGRKKLLRDSRIETTKLLVRALSNMSKRPATLINASGIGYYGLDASGTVTESSPAGQDFLARLCVDWEREAARAEEFGLRVVTVRLGMVLGHDGGALPKMLLPFRLFLGGPISPGDQPISWIHVEDAAQLIHWSLETQQVQGPVNAVAPTPCTMEEFCQTIGKVLSRPSWLPVPQWTLNLALGELSTLMTTGQRVEPRVALGHGFAYSHPSLETALRSLLQSM